ncbi:MAG: hypothetical protein R6V85_08575 [Polyangia bacterium]
MAKTDLEKTIEEVAHDFALKVVAAVKDSTLQELMNLQPGEKAATPAASKPRRGRPPKKKKNAKKAAASKSKKKVKRLTRTQRAKVLDDIVDYLRKSPNSKASDVSKAVGMDTRKTGQYLKELREQGRVDAEGVKAKMTYTAK